MRRIACRCAATTCAGELPSDARGKNVIQNRRMMPAPLTSRSVSESAGCEDAEVAVPASGIRAARVHGPPGVRQDEAAEPARLDGEGASREGGDEGGKQHECERGARHARDATPADPGHTSNAPSRGSLTSANRL